MDIRELEILTDDIDGTEKFYTQILELNLIRKNDNYISFGVGASILTFLKSNHLNPQYHFAFNIPDNKLDEAIRFISIKLEIIKISGHEIVADFVNWNAKAFYFYDNNGNILEYIARFDLNNQIDVPFGGSTIQSISEIGIVTDDVTKLTDHLLAGENLSIFPKQKRQDHFTVLGDDHGLLIIVSTNRTWYPTEQRSEKHYLKVQLMLDGVQKELTFAPNTSTPLSNREDLH